MFLSLRSRSGCDTYFLISLCNAINNKRKCWFTTNQCLFYFADEILTSTWQESKPSSEVNFQLYCYDDANQRDEIERLHHMIVEMESENGCNRLLLTKLEDELLSTRRREIRTVRLRQLTTYIKFIFFLLLFLTHRNMIVISKPINWKFFGIK